MEPRKHVFGKTLGYIFALTLFIVVLFALQIRRVSEREAAEASAYALDAAFTENAALTVHPLAPLDEHCTRCHSERRYLTFHGSDEDFNAIVEQMKSKPDFTLTPEEREKVYASLSLIECTRCHKISSLQKFCMMDEPDQAGVLNKMSTVPSATIGQADFAGIQRAAKTIRGK